MTMSQYNSLGEIREICGCIRKPKSVRHLDTYALGFKYSLGSWWLVFIVRLSF
jgi:hypothetical protein